MPALKRHLNARWIATWLAVFGLVFAPTLSRAMVALGGMSEFAEVCALEAGAAAPRSARTDQSKANPESDGKARLHLLTAHCPLCIFASGDDLAPPPAPFALWLSPLSLPSVVAPARTLAVDLAPRTRPQPRAPPQSA